MLTEEREDSLLLFFYLPSTTDPKESINQYRDHVQLYPIDCMYNDFTKYLSKGEKFMPQDLDSKDTKKRALAGEMVVNFFKGAIQISNSNLKRNYQDKFKVTY